MKFKFIIMTFIYLFVWNIAISQTKNILDEIEIIDYKTPIDYYIDYSFDTVFIDLDSITSFDTLKIGAILCGCGEFGSHTEEINVYLKNEIMYGEYKNFGGITDCPWESIVLPKDFVLNRDYDSIVRLNEIDKEFINNYIRFFWFFERGHSYSNAPQDYWMTLQNKTYKRKDLSGQWKQFELLRDKIFKKE